MTTRYNDSFGSDPRDFVDPDDQKFRATLDLTQRSVIVIEVPTVRHSKLHDWAENDAAKLAFNMDCEKTREAEGVARVDYRVMYLLLLTTIGLCALFFERNRFAGINLIASYDLLSAFL